jgi:hypothetical protein
MLIEKLEITTRYGGRGIVASAETPEGRRTAQSTQGHLTAATKLTAMVAFGSCQGQFLKAAQHEFEIRQTQVHPDGDRVFTATARYHDRR